MYYTENQKIEARSTDMILFLEAIEGFCFKRCGNEYHCKSHDSLVIKADRRTWYWNSRTLRGRSAIDWCMTVRGMTFTSSMQLLVGAPQGEKRSRGERHYNKKASVDSEAFNYVKISNKLLELELTNAELAVIAYLSTIRTSVISKSGTAWIRVKQSTIAAKCAISVQTVGRAVSSLMEKGLIWRSARILKSDNKSGTTCYALSLPSLDSGYFMLDRRAVNGTLLPRQLRVYLHLCRCIDNRLGYCWNSYNDLAEIIGIKRSDVIQIVGELCRLHYIVKQRVRQRDNRKVFADNHYSLILIGKPAIYRRNKKIEAALKATTGNFTKTNKTMNYTSLHYTTPNSFCQVFSAKKRENIFLRGSP